jgi:hypothetical protein
MSARVYSQCRTAVRKERQVWIPVESSFTRSIRQLELALSATLCLPAGFAYKGLMKFAQAAGDVTQERTRLLDLTG